MLGKMDEMADLAGKYERTINCMETIKIIEDLSTILMVYRISQWWKRKNWKYRKIWSFNACELNYMQVEKSVEIRNFFNWIIPRNTGWLFLSVCSLKIVRANKTSNSFERNKIAVVLIPSSPEPVTECRKPKPSGEEQTQCHVYPCPCYVLRYFSQRSLKNCCKKNNLNLQIVDFNINCTWEVRLEYAIPATDL